MTGSRAGLLLALVSAGLAWWVYRPPVAVGRVDTVRKERRGRIAGGVTAVILAAAIAVIGVKTSAFQRLIETDAASELRVQALPVVIEATGRFFPVGSGIGTFVEVYQIFEPDRLISNSYFNHAHNDFIEIAMNGGVPALALMLFGVFLFGTWGVALKKNRKYSATDSDFAEQQLGIASISVLIVLAMASGVDYPLRSPSLLIYAAIMAGWCSNAYRLGRK
jgi:O-antigen ligase